MPDRWTRLTGLGAMLPESLWRELLALGPRVNRPAGQVLMHQGDPGDVVFVLVRGRVRISQYEIDGVEMPLAIRRPGEVLGDIAVLGGTARTATVSAVDTCDVHAVSGPLFVGFVSRHTLAQLLLRHSFGRLKEAERYRAELAVLPMYQRLCRTLLRLAEPDGEGGAVVEVGMSQEDLGRMIGAARNTVVGMLARLRDEGVVGTSRQRVVVRDIDALRARATPPDAA